MTRSNRCSARKSDGTACKAWPIHGAKVCRVHGGSAPQVKAAAKARLAEAEARKQATNYVHNAGELADPLGELLRVAGEMVAWKDWLGERVGQLQADEYRYKSGQGLEQLRSEIGLYTQAMSQVHKVIESLAKLDLEARRTSVIERDASAIVALLQNVLGDLDLTPAQHALAATVVPARLVELETGKDSQPFGRSEPAALPRAR